MYTFFVYVQRSRLEKAIEKQKKKEEVKLWRAAATAHTQNYIAHRSHNNANDE